MMTSLKERKFEKKKARMLNLKTAQKEAEKKQKAYIKRKREEVRLFQIFYHILNHLINQAKI